MDEVHQQGPKVWQFVRRHLGRIVVGLILVAMVYGAMIVMAPHLREKRVGDKLSSLGGFGYTFGYGGPDWIPEGLRSRLQIFDRISGIHVVYQSTPCPRMYHPELKSETEMSDLLTDFGSLQNLQFLDLNGTQIRDAGLERLKGSTALQRLNIGSTQVTDTGLVHLKGLTQLNHVDLSNTLVTDGGLIHLKALAYLVLHLDNLNVTDEGLKHLKGMILWKLYLNQTNITDEGIEYLKGMNILESLELKGTRVTDVGLEHLTGFTSLKELNLTDTQTTEVGRAMLRKALPICKIEPNP